MIKRVNDDMKNVEDIRTRANNYMELEEPYAGETEVLHFLEVLRDKVGFDELKKKVTNPLTGKKIGVQLGTTGDIYAEDIEDAEVERYNKGMEAVQALQQDKIDAVVIDGEPAKVFAAENEGLKILDEPLTEEEYAIAIAKDNDELLEKVNTALANLKDSGKLDEIIGKYISAE